MSNLEIIAWCIALIGLILCIPLFHATICLAMHDFNIKEWWNDVEKD